MKKEKREPIHILHFVPSMRAAGIENFIMNLYRRIDRSRIQFDFVVHTKEPQIYDNEIEKLGGKIYRLTYKDDKNLIKYIKDLHRLFIEHPEYKIVHGNMQSMMPVYLRIAKKHGVPVRIAHAHNSNYEKTIKGLLLHILSRFAKNEATTRFACSNEAGKYLFGKQKFEFIPNAIDIKKFKFNQISRNKTREELGIKDDEILIGHIGRFEKQKNHKRLIKIFSDIHRNNPKAKLCLVGIGKLENDIKEKAKRLNLLENIHFLGQRANTSKLYSAMDVFLFPSYYEGLPVTVLEAQSSDLPCVISDTITSQVILTNNIVQVGLKRSNKEWAAHTMQMINSKGKRNCNHRAIEQSIFNIIESNKKMTDLYEKLLKGE